MLLKLKRRRFKKNNNYPCTPLVRGHSTNINACGVLGVKVWVQVFNREFHTHIHLDQVRIEIISCINNNNNNNNWKKYFIDF